MPARRARVAVDRRGTTAPWRATAPVRTSTRRRAARRGRSPRRRPRRPTAAGAGAAPAAGTPSARGTARSWPSNASFSSVHTRRRISSASSMRGAALAEVRAVHLVLEGPPAEADAERDPPARQLVDRRDLLGDPNRVVHRQLEDAGADPQRRWCGPRPSAMNVSGSLMLPGMKWWWPIVAVSKPASSAIRASSNVSRNGSALRRHRATRGARARTSRADVYHAVVEWPPCRSAPVPAPICSPCCTAAGRWDDRTLADGIEAAAPALARRPCGRRQRPRAQLRRARGPGARDGRHPRRPPRDARRGRRACRRQHRRRAGRLPRAAPAGATIAVLYRRTGGADVREARAGPRRPGARRRPPVRRDRLAADSR